MSGQTCRGHKGRLAPGPTAVSPFARSTPFPGRRQHDCQSTGVPAEAGADNRASLKSGPIRRLLTRLADEIHEREPHRDRPVRILNCMGMRAESTRPGRMAPAQRNDRVSTGRKEVIDYLPYAWTTAAVWAEVDAVGLEDYIAYHVGQSRAGCVFLLLPVARRAAL